MHNSSTNFKIQYREACVPTCEGGCEGEARAARGRDQAGGGAEQATAADWPGLRWNIWDKGWWSGFDKCYSNLDTLTLLDLHHKDKERVKHCKSFYQIIKKKLLQLVVMEERENKKIS